MTANVQYKLKVEVDKRSVEMDVMQETNYAGGEPAQLVTLFFRSMLAHGYPVAITTDAFGRLAETYGYNYRSNRNIDAVLGGLKEACDVP